MNSLRNVLLISTLALVVLEQAGRVTAQSQSAAKHDRAQGPAATAQLNDAQGKTVGRVELVETPHGVLASVTLTGAAPGEHAFHVHETGKCDAPTFESAGGHFNPRKAQHGFLNAKGPHAGDLPNLHVPSSGQLEFEAFLDGVTLKKGANSLEDADGAALVLHAKPDDHRSDPAGEAGDRIACGVVQAQ